MHPASYTKRRAFRLDAKPFATCEVEPLHVRLLRLEQVPLHFQAATERSVDGALLDVEGGRVFELISAGRKDERRVLVLTAILRGFSQGLGVVLPVVGNSSELRDRNAPSCHICCKTKQGK